MTDYNGECILTALYDDWTDDDLDGDHDVRIDRADLRIMVTEAALAELDARGWVGEGVFVIKAVNGTARYALQHHDADRHIWTARRIGPDPSRLADGART